MLRLALTCDDAPTIRAAPPLVQRDPARMDRLRIALRQQGVESCVAFVIGAEASDAGPLRRWLEAGYELGNHTHEHPAASAAGPEPFLESVARCDARLDALGAWPSGAPKWFRFPYLDHGADPEARARIAQGLRAMGYRIAHATVDLHDDRFEEALAHAEARGAWLRAELVGARYRHTADRALARARASLGPSTPQVPYFHFGAVSERFVAGVLRRWRRAGARFCGLDEALSHPELQREEGTGLLLGRRRPPLLERLGRRAQRLHNRLDPSRGRWVGPPWPRVRG